MLRKLFLLFSFFFFFLVVIGNNIQYGLTFHSHSVNQDLRTSLNLTPDKPLSLPVGFSLEFAIKFNLGIQSYGYVCRVISDDSKTFDIISHINARKLNCVLIDVDKALSNVDFNIIDSSRKKDWNKIKIEFQSDKINCYINEEVQVIPYSFTNFRKIRICFGRNWDKLFYSSDVPPISIKDIVISDENGKALYNWEMNKYIGNRVYDSIRKREAIVENASWDVDKYVEWHKEISIPIGGKYPQLAFDSIKDIFYVATADSILSFNIQTKAVERKKTKKGSPFAAATCSQLIYDSTKDRLISYSLLYPDFIVYDFEKNEWSGDKLDQRFVPDHQHNRFIDLKKNRLVTFGGYGHQTYKAWLSFHSLDGGEWDIHDLSAQIAPRYLSALGYWGDDKILILGGYGSLSGRQEESPKNFYDLYEIDSHNLTCKKLFDLKVPTQPLVFSNSMIIDKKKDKIYALAFNNINFHTFLTLCEINLVNGGVTLLDDSIPYNFLDIESFCDLILDEEKSVLYTVLIQKKGEENVMDIYSLSYPPLKMSDVIQSDVPIKKNIVLLLLFILITLSVLFFVGIFLKRKKKQKSRFTAKETSLLKEDYQDIIKPHFKRKKISSTIILLGGFQVFDREGNDITDKFTPILKQVFLFILLNSIKNGKKITSEKLDETFWFEMDKTNAKNNRNVNIHKLRLLLDMVGDISVLNKGSYWFVEFGNDIKCDYKEVIELLKRLKEEKEFDLSVLNAILEIASNGILLPNMNLGWVDNYKSEYSTHLIDILTKSLCLPIVVSDLKLQIKISDVILLHDNIDEEAIRVKCKALFLLGQKGTSKQCFDKFTQDYFELLNTTPPINYEDIMK